MPSTSDTPQFSSAGFDVSAASEDDVILEIGGGATKVTVKSPAATTASAALPTETDPVMAQAEEFKAQGNAAFKQQNWDLALELYTKAIDSTPGMTATELLELQADFVEQQGKEMRKRFMQQEEDRRAKRKDDTAEAGSSSAASDDKDEYKPPPPEPFIAPPHAHAEQLSVYHCNRAAVYLHLQNYQDVIRDCDAAILWKPNYTKALMRRCQAHEALDKTDCALEDAKLALKTDPMNAKLLQTIKRLEKLEAERMEKLKAETMDKLKELGNSILGNFGLSLDNFKAVQDPNTGSYSLSFGNNEPKES